MKVVDAAKVFNWLSDCVFAIAPWNNERNKNADYSAIDVANKQIEVLREVMQYIEESEFDAVPVVRCKDCIWFKDGELFTDKKMCYRHSQIRGIGKLVTYADDYCSFGKTEDDGGSQWI